MQLVYRPLSYPFILFLEKPILNSSLTFLTVHSGRSPVSTGTFRTRNGGAPSVGGTEPSTIVRIIIVKNMTRQRVSVPTAMSKYQFSLLYQSICIFSFKVYFKIVPFLIVKNPSLLINQILMAY